ncbi:MAG: hypothetical protein ACLFNI_11505 [Natronomonas sp.]
MSLDTNGGLPGLGFVILLVLACSSGAGFSKAHAILLFTSKIPRVTVYWFQTLHFDR